MYDSQNKEHRSELAIQLENATIKERRVNLKHEIKLRSVFAVLQSELNHVMTKHDHREA